MPFGIANCDFARNWLYKFGEQMGKGVEDQFSVSLQGYRVVRKVDLQKSDADICREFGVIIKGSRPPWRGDVLQVKSS